MLKVKGALTGKSMSVPSNNIGLIMECQRSDFTEDFYNEYPEKFTRVYLKTSLGEIKFVDCAESVKEVTTGQPDYSFRFFLGMSSVLAAMLLFIIYG